MSTDRPMPERQCPTCKQWFWLLNYYSHREYGCTGAAK